VLLLLSKQRPVSNNETKKQSKPFFQFQIAATLSCSERSPNGALCIPADGTGAPRKRAKFKRKPARAAWPALCGTACRWVQASC